MGQITIKPKNYKTTQLTEWGNITFLVSFSFPLQWQNNFEVFRTIYKRKPYFCGFCWYVSTKYKTMKMCFLGELLDYSENNCGFPVSFLWVRIGIEMRQLLIGKNSVEIFSGILKTSVSRTHFRLQSKYFKPLKTFRSSSLFIESCNNCLWM